jgi:hypothetical protein
MGSVATDREWPKAGAPDEFRWEKRMADANGDHGFILKPDLFQLRCRNRLARAPAPPRCAALLTLGLPHLLFFSLLFLFCSLPPLWGVHLTNLTSPTTPSST